MSGVMHIFQRGRTRWGSIAVLVMLCLRLVGCSGGEGPVDPPPPPPNGAITGQVVEGSSNAPVAGATVRTGAGTVATGSDGKFNVPAPAGDRTVVQIEADGFAAAFLVARVRTGQTTVLGVKLLQVGVTQSVSVSAGGTVNVPGSTAQVVLPPDGLVPQNGGPAAGTVTVSVTPINPATNPSLMPGDFTGRVAGGASDTPIESFGALSVEIRDAAGTRYALASGKTATIRIPLGTLSPNPPPTIPLWYFNETTGIWQEEGTATLQPGTGAGRFYQGTVVRFTRYWNADRATETIVVSGCVTDRNGQPVPNLLVTTTGVDYSGTASAVTKQDGTFRVAMRKDGRATVNGEEIDPQTFTRRPATDVVEVPVSQSSGDVTLAKCLVLNRVVITTTSPLPEGRVGDAYTQTLVAAGGTPGYHWSLNTGSPDLPNALQLNSTGVISGVPTTVGSTTIVVKVTDNVGGTDTQALTLTIRKGDEPPQITTPSPLLTGLVGTLYNQPLTATGGTGALKWTVSNGQLPSGLNLDESTGVISGTPRAAGTVTITIRVEDSAATPKSNEKVFALTIDQTPLPINITTTSPLLNGTVGADYRQTISATGGTGARKWTVSIGQLPNGLRLDESTGVISGRPTAAGTTTITIRVEDSAVPPQSDEQAFNLTVTQIPPPTCGTGTTNCLKVTNAPAKVGDLFVPTTTEISRFEEGSVAWSKTNSTGKAVATLQVGLLAGRPIAQFFADIDDNGGVGLWSCTNSAGQCTGITFDRRLGAATFNNAVLVSNDSSITLNGTLTFTPF